MAFLNTSVASSFKNPKTMNISESANKNIDFFRIIQSPNNIYKVEKQILQ